jgi:hypothetical protein
MLRPEFQLQGAKVPALMVLTPRRAKLQVRAFLA